MRLAKDPDGLASELARPMPRKPNRAARFGTRFHAWVESYFGQQLLLDPDDLPGAADEDIVDDTDLTELMDAFRIGPYGETTPYEIEAPFALALGGRVIRGRIDAVYQVVRPDGSRGYDVIDWKTTRTESADPLQLAIYRVAWSELMNIPLDQVTAAFYYVRTADIVRPENLPGERGTDRPPERLATRSAGTTRTGNGKLRLEHIPAHDDRPLDVSSRCPTQAQSACSLLWIEHPVAT